MIKGISVLLGYEAGSLGKRLKFRRVDYNTIIKLLNIESIYSFLKAVEMSK